MFGTFIDLGHWKSDGRQACILLGDKIVGTVRSEMENLGSVDYPSWVTARYVVEVVGHSMTFPVFLSTAQTRARALSWAKKRVAEALETR